MEIDQFVLENYDGKPDWFVDYVNETSNQMRIMDVVDKKEYLAGIHPILKRPNEKFNGKEFVPRKIVLQYARQLLVFQTSYLVGSPITLTGNEKVVNAVSQIYKQGQYSKVDFDVVHSVNRFGNAYEYVFLNKDRQVRSKIIDAADSYPVITDDNEYVAFVESWTTGNVTYYYVYFSDRVEKYNDAGGSLNHIGTFKNISGLPVIYKNENPLDTVFGRSELDDYKSIIDSMEDLISKSIDSFYKYMQGIPVVTGQRLTNEQLPTEIIGGGLVLDSDASFEFKQNLFDHEAFATLYKHLMMSLMDVSSTPSVAMGKVDVSNLSEMSLKLLYTLTNLKALMTERYIRGSMMERFERFRRLLEIQGERFDDEEWNTLDVVFKYAQPVSEKDVIENLTKLRAMSAISTESILSHSPYTNDVASELKRLANEKLIVDGDKVDS